MDRDDRYRYIPRLSNHQQRRPQVDAFEELEAIENNLFSYLQEKTTIPSSSSNHQRYDDHSPPPLPSHMHRQPPSHMHQSSQFSRVDKFYREQQSKPTTDARSHINYLDDDHYRRDVSSSRQHTEAPPSEDSYRNRLEMLIESLQKDDDDTLPTDQIDRSLIDQRLMEIRKSRMEFAELEQSLHQEPPPPGPTYPSFNERVPSIRELRHHSTDYSPPLRKSRYVFSFSLVLFTVCFVKD